MTFFLRIVKLNASAVICTYDGKRLNTRQWSIQGYYTWPAGCAIDLEALKIVPGKRCWVLTLDGLVLSSDGNLLTALSIAAKASC